MTTKPRPQRLRRRMSAGILAATALTGSAGVFAACGSSSTPAAPTTTAGASATSSSTTAAGVGEQVLPIDANPITNTATGQAFTIDSVLVENNEDAFGAATDDHLEIAVTNTSNADLGGFEVFYTYDDPTTSTTENYYAKLPDTFRVTAGATRTIHFDNTGAEDHFAVNQFSLYYTDTNALDVNVEVSATDSAPQTTSVRKDAGGAEVPD